MTSVSRSLPTLNIPFNTLQHPRLGGETSYGRWNLRPVVESMGAIPLYSSVTFPRIVCQISLQVCNAGKKEHNVCIDEQRTTLSDPITPNKVHVLLWILHDECSIFISSNQLQFLHSRYTLIDIFFVRRWHCEYGHEDHTHIVKDITSVLLPEARRKISIAKITATINNVSPGNFPAKKCRLLEKRKPTRELKAKNLVDNAIESCRFT